MTFNRIQKRKGTTKEQRRLAKNLPLKKIIKFYSEKYLKFTTKKNFETT